LNEPRKPVNQTLGGVRVLVTRPRHQQAAFVRLLDAAGATPVPFPCIDIESLGHQAQTNLARARDADLLIFTSVNAVEETHRCGVLPLGRAFEGTILAVGKATAARLAELGTPVYKAPQPPYNSESLIELIRTELNNLQNVAIIKGEGGRELLNETLHESGKKVDLIDVYRRKAPVVNQQEVNTVFLPSGPDIVSITSNATLQNLVLMAGDSFADPLLNLPLVVNSQRNAELAHTLGFQSHVLIAKEPGDQGQLEALNYWNRSYRF